MNEKSDASPMTLEEYKVDCMARIESFARHWLENSKVDPVHWPQIMPVGEWDEQMRAFEEMA